MSSLQLEELKDAYKEMLLIRKFENRAMELFTDGLVESSIHLYNGEEAVSVGVCKALDDKDLVVSSHRPHGHAISKGVDLKKIAAELLGRREGICGGKGGSMHMSSVDVGFIESTGIVGSSMPHAVGIGMANKLDDNSKIVVSFFGDAASNQGVFGESLNLSRIWDIPVLWACENNCWAISTKSEYACGGEIARRAEGYNIDWEVVDGMDVTDVYEKTSKYIDQVREGNPVLLEYRCYRFKGHSRADPEYGPDHYRQKEEVEKWLEKDPIINLAEKINLSDDEKNRIESEVEEKIEEAIEFAKNAPRPTMEDLYVY